MPVATKFIERTSHGTFEGKRETAAGEVKGWWLGGVWARIKKDQGVGGELSAPAPRNDCIGGSLHPMTSLELLLHTPQHHSLSGHPIPVSIVEFVEHTNTHGTMAPCPAPPGVTTVNLSDILQQPYFCGRPL
jgi:hypothetical protein